MLKLTIVKKFTNIFLLLGRKSMIKAVYAKTILLKPDTHTQMNIPMTK
jgi:hypothetical protein